MATLEARGGAHDRTATSAASPATVEKQDSKVVLAVLVVGVSLLEASTLYVWLRLYLDDAPWLGLAALAAGEIVETVGLVFVVGRRARKRWGPPPSDRGHFRGVRLMIAFAGVAEIGVWLAWLETERALGPVVAGGVLLVLMHVKHTLEARAVCATGFRTQFFPWSAALASASEVGGAVGGLLLVQNEQFVFACLALGVGLLIEHVILLEGLRLEISSRDIRLPRNPRWPLLSLERRWKRYWLTHFPRLWRLVQRIRPLEQFANRFAINGLLGSMDPRPNPLSTRDPYTSWPSLVDRTFSGRHLGPVPDDATTPATDPDGAPPVAEVAELFKRQGPMRECPRSTLLFAFFAQWLTDGFLRSERKRSAEREPGTERNTLRNESTHQIDLSQVYGLNQDATEQLRADRGELKHQLINDEEYPPYYSHGVTVKREFDKLLPPLDFDSKALLPEVKAKLFASGTDVHNLGVVAFNTLFLREHNRIARRLRSENPSWKDVRVFETARNVLTVVLLRIIVEEYINHITSSRFKFRLFPRSFPRERWYRPNWMAIEFNLLYRWHSLVPPTFHLNGTALPMESTLYDTSVLTDAGLGAVMAATSSQPAGRIGLLNTDERLVKRAEVPSIKQGRVARLASYNDYRRHCRLAPRASFPEISSDPAIYERLEALYGEPEAVEFYVGLFAEDTVRNGVLPELMNIMVAYDAFSQALTNPLLASPRIFNEATFSPAGMEIIRETRSIADLVKRNTPCGSPDSYVGFSRREIRQT